MIPISLAIQIDTPQDAHSVAAPPQIPQPLHRPATEAASNEGPGGLDKVADLEASGKFPEATDLFYKLRLQQRYPNHALKIGAVQASERKLTDLINLEQFAGARDALQTTQSKLDVLEDSGLVIYLQQRRADLSIAARKVSDANAGELLKLAKALAAEGRLTEASAMDQRIIDLKDPETPSISLIQSAAADKDHVEQAKTDLVQPGTWAQLWSSTFLGLRTVASWIVIGSPIILAFILIRCVAGLIPHRGARLALTDLSVPLSERDDKSRLLTTEVSLRLGALGNAEASVSELDGSPDLDGTGMPNVAIDRQPPSESFPLTSEAVRLGPFSFNPLQLWAIAKLAVRRPHDYELSGWLLTRENGVLIAVDNLRMPGSRKLDRWQCSADAPVVADARILVIREMVLKIAFEISSHNPRAITDVASSFRAYYLAQDILAEARKSPERKSKLEAARNLLQEATQADPSNWVAWFSLATVLRKLGNNKEAAEHFKFLTERLAVPGPRLKQLIFDKPDFKWTVWYNYAVCLTKVGDWHSHNGAIAILTALVAI